MATPIGTNTVTSIARRYIMPEIVDNVYLSNPLFFRMTQGNKRTIQGGTQIEIPLMYARFAAGGPYQGFEILNVAPSDTVKNGAVDWKQHFVPVTVDGLTLIKTDSPQSIANIIRLLFAQARMEMAENLATGLYADGIANPKEIDGLKAAVDDGTVAATYAGLNRTTNTWWRSQVDAATATLTFTALNSLFGNVGEGGRTPSLILSRIEQWNRYWALGVAKQSYSVNMPGTYDQLLQNAGFTNQLFNGVPWVQDSHVFDGPNTSNSAILMLTEDYIEWGVSPRADMYLEDFQTPVDQDAMTAKLLWAGNLIVTNCARQGKMTAVTG